jgi:hypothetical protein
MDTTETSKLTVRTNHHHYPLLSGYELTPKERKELDYLTDDELNESSDRFFRYRGQVYDVQEFMRCDPNSPFNQHRNMLAHKQWQGYQSDSFFSGVVIRYTDGNTGGHDDFGYVQVGTYFS